MNLSDSETQNIPLLKGVPIFLYKIGSFDLVIRDVGNTTEIFNSSVSAFSDAKPLINHHVTSKSIISEHRCIFLGNEHC